MAAAPGAFAKVSGQLESANVATRFCGRVHAIGARPFAEHAERSELDPAFTIHDRENSTDLMSLVCCK